MGNVASDPWRHYLGPLSVSLRACYAVRAVLVSRIVAIGKLRGVRVCAGRPDPSLLSAGLVGAVESLLESFELALLRGAASV